MRDKCYAVKYLKEKSKMCCMLRCMLCNNIGTKTPLHTSPKILKLKNIYMNFKNDSLKTEIMTYNMVCHGIPCRVRISCC